MDRHEMQQPSTKPSVHTRRAAGDQIGNAQPDVGGRFLDLRPPAVVAWEAKNAGFLVVAQTISHSIVCFSEIELESSAVACHSGAFAGSKWMQRHKCESEHFACHIP